MKKGELSGHVRDRIRLKYHGAHALLEQLRAFAAKPAGEREQALPSAHPVALKRASASLT